MRDERGATSRWLARAGAFGGFHRPRQRGGAQARGHGERPWGDGKGLSVGLQAEAGRQQGRVQRRAGAAWKRRTRSRWGAGGANTYSFLLRALANVSESCLLKRGKR